MSMWQFFDNHSVGLFWCCVFFGSAVLHFFFKCWNRLMRHLSVRKHGWPPPHLDADGDFAAVQETKLREPECDGGGDHEWEDWEPCAGATEVGILERTCRDCGWRQRKKVWSP